MKSVMKIINIIALISAFICLFYNQNTNYNLAFLLPFLVFLLNIANGNIFAFFKKSFIFYIIYFQIIIRYIIIPLIISTTGDYFTGFSSTNGTEAIIIMGLELMFIFIVFSIVHKKQYKSYKLRSKSIELLKGGIVTYSILIAMLLLLLSTSFFLKVNFIWELNTYIENVINSEIEITSPAGVLFSPFKAILSLLIISIIAKNRKFQNQTKLFLLLIILLVNVILIVGVSRFSIVFSLLPLFFILLLMFTSYKKKLILAIIVLIIPVLLITTISKFSRNDKKITTTEILSSASLNAYFSGMGNVATGLDTFYNNGDINHFAFFTNDIFQNVPIASKLTNEKLQTNFYFNKQIYNDLEAKDQIAPLVTSGFFHFNIFGAFLYGPLFVLIAFYFERKFYRYNFIGYKYFYIHLSIYFSLIFMLNFGAIISTFITSYILLFIPFFFIKKFKKN